MNFYTDPVAWFYAHQNEVVPLKDYDWESHWGHPRTQGFHRPDAAEDRKGKTDDWVLSIPENGRLHAQLIYGRWRFHWDRKDPEKGEALEHVFQETKIGQVLAGIGIVGGVCLGIGLLASAFSTED